MVLDPFRIKFNLNAQKTVSWRIFYYNRKSIPVVGAGFGPGTGPILMDTVRCVGSEIAFDRCSYSSQHDCNHDEDAGVVCTDDGLYNIVSHRLTVSKRK